MRVACTHIGSGQFVIDAQDLEDFKPAQGERFVADVARRRNVGHHRKGFELLHQMHSNQDKFDDISFDEFRKWVMISAGFCKVFRVGEKEWVEPESLKFDKMSQDKFQEVYTQIVTVAVEKLGLDFALTFE